MYNFVNNVDKKEGVSVDNAQYVKMRNPIFLVRTNNYRSVVLGYRDGEVVFRKYFLADTQLEARHKATEFMERWKKEHDKEESN